MTKPDLLALLREKVAERGQSTVASALGVSPACISQILSGTYKASPDNVLAKVEEVYGQTTVTCPVLGEISLGKCGEKRRQPFAATNPQRVALFRACQKCPQNGGKP